MFYPNPSRICLLDWKTSRKNKDKKYCHDYFLQLAAYSNALLETYRIKVTSANVCLFYDFQPPSIHTITNDEIDIYFKEFLEKLSNHKSSANNRFSAANLAR